MEKCASYLFNAYSYGESLAHAEIEKFAREGQDQTTAQHVSTGLAGIPGLGVLGAPLAAPDGTGWGSFGATGFGQSMGGSTGALIGGYLGLQGAIDEVKSMKKLQDLEKVLGHGLKPVIGGLLGAAAGGAGMNYLHQRSQRDHGNV